MEDSLGDDEIHTVHRIGRICFWRDDTRSQYKVEVRKYSVL